MNNLIEYTMGGIAVVLVAATTALAFYVRALANRLSVQRGETECYKSELGKLIELYRELEARSAKCQDFLDRVEQEMVIHGLHRTVESSAYHSAIKLAKKGLGIEELMESCGVSRGEGELILQLHGRARGRPSPAYQI